MRWGKVFAIAGKESRDILRDRRTVFLAVVFPLILYPLLIIGLVQMTLTQQSISSTHKMRVVVAGRQLCPEVWKALAEDEEIEVAEFGGGEKGLRQSSATVGVVFPEGFDEALSQQGTAEVRLFFDSADQRSLDAVAKVTGILNDYSGRVLGERLEGEGLSEQFVEPLKLDRRDIATPKERGAFRFGKVLAFLLVVLCMMGALYPAIDAVSGEKERGTLETLLSIPATRFEVLAGKYLAVFGMSIVSVLSNFISLSATMFLLNFQIVAAAPGGSSIDFTVPMSAFIIFIPALLPLAAFFSAVSLGVAAFAKSTREGQYYLGPLYAGALPLTALAMAPTVELTWFTALVPILSIALFLKAGLLGTLHAGPALLAVGSTCLYAFLALKWAASVFSREDVLFGSSADSGPAAAKGIPTPTQAVFVWVVSVILFFFVGFSLSARYGIGNLGVSLFVNIGIVLGPALAFGVFRRIDWKRVFPIAPLPRRKALSLLFFVPAAVLLGLAANAVGSYLLPVPAAAKAASASRFEISVYAFFLSIVFLPAICEELFYRGFLLKAFEHRMRPVWAVVASAALFAVAHLNVYELLPLFVLGVLLAVVARSTGGLLAPIVIHFCNNLLALALRFGWLHGSFFGRDLTGSAAALVIVAFTVGGLVAVWAGVRLAGGRVVESH